MRRLRAHATLTISGALLVSALTDVGTIVADDRFVQQINLPSGQVVIVAEGDLEPRSVGTYTVRLYSGKSPRSPVDDFIAGALRERDGVVEKVLLADVDSDGRVEVIVIVRNVGSGSYLSGDAFAFDQKRLTLRASVKNLPKDADVVSALKKMSSLRAVGR
jgi:hypothetical protein